MASNKKEGTPQAVTAFPQTQAERIRLRNKAEFGSKIRALRTAKGMTQPQLAALLGVTKNSVTNWEAGTSRPELSLIPGLCKALEVSADVFFGLPETRLTAPEREHLRLYRALDRYQQRSVDALMDAMIENQRLAFRDACAAAFTRIERMPLPALAGTGMPLTDLYEKDVVYLRNSPAVDRADVLITVRGDSMTPTYSDGDDLLVEYTPEVRAGEIGIFIVAGEAFVKEYRADGLHSHNPRYKTINPGPDDGFRCVGRVLDAVTQDMLATPREAAVLDEIYASESK